ncbi:MAG TPA: ABC transporter ATP-binding protein [Patescibacteria group bacterium]|nr:ABC transporter ATP-binding protein [Patescibacteria group bacterium]
MIRLDHVSAQVQGKEILKDINLEIHTGEIMVIIGPSGSGKSTLLRLMIGLMKPAAGEVWIDGQEISRMNEDQLNEVRLRMGMVFQYSALFDSMNVGENVAFGLREHSQLSEVEIRRQVRRKLRMVGLSGQEATMPNALSGGMKKRVSLARAIAVDPRIVLYDEPTSGLDPIMSGTIDRLIASTRRMLGVTSVVVTHDMASAFNIADRLAMIHQGQIIETGGVEDIRHSVNPLVQRFIRSENAKINARKEKQNE